MPTIRQSRNVDISDTDSLPAATIQRRTPPPPEDREVRRPNMQAAMPLSASTGDAFARQFYGAGTVPSYRILPATNKRKGATA